MALQHHHRSWRLSLIFQFNAPKPNFHTNFAYEPWKYPKHLSKPSQVKKYKNRLTQPWDTYNAARLKRCLCHVDWRWTLDKSWAERDKWEPVSENTADVLRLPHRMIFTCFSYTWKCHRVPACRAKRYRQCFGDPLKNIATRQPESRRHIFELQSQHFMQNSFIYVPIL